jgi:hypothetical protein
VTAVKRLVAALRALWSREPVLIETGLPALVSLGVIGAGQAALITHDAANIAAAVSGLAAVVGSLHARSVVFAPKGVPTRPSA